MARPRKKIDASQVEGLAAIHCTTDEIGAVLGCSRDTLERRYAASIKDGRARGRASLRRKQWELAQSGNATMLIWLGKQLLGQTDKVMEQIDMTTRALPPLVIDLSGANVPIDHIEI
jgi:hypothetical protein